MFLVLVVTAKELVENHKIYSVDELKDKYMKGKIELPPQIEMGLKYHGIFKENIPRKEIDEINELMQKIGKQINKKMHVIITGSYRRGKSTSNDIDILISNGKNDMHAFINKLKKDKFIIDDLTTEYDVKYMGYCKFKNNPPRRIDVKYAPEESFYTLLLHMTGSAHFNAQIRELAKHLGYKLNEYGLYQLKKDKQIRIELKSEGCLIFWLGIY
jgi:DNA polymerase/3'-5' exonuclease PolX